jgi:hypothetical protein
MRVNDFNPVRQTKPVGQRNVRHRFWRKNTAGGLYGEGNQKLGNPKIFHSQGFFLVSHFTSWA